MQESHEGIVLDGLRAFKSLFKGAGTGKDESRVKCRVVVLVPTGFDEVRIGLFSSKEDVVNAYPTPFTRGSASRSLDQIGSASEMEYARREGVLTEYGAIAPVHVGSSPVAVAVFPAIPGDPVFHPTPVMSSAPGSTARSLLLVSIPESMDYVVSSGDKVPDYCSNSGQLADKPCLTNRGLFSGLPTGGLL